MTTTNPSSSGLCVHCKVICRGGIPPPRRQSIRERDSHGKMRSLAMHLYPPSMSIHFHSDFLDMPEQDRKVSSSSFISVYCPPEFCNVTSNKQSISAPSISAYCDTAEPSCGGPESASWLAFLFPPKTERNRSRAGCVIRCTREGPSTASLLFPASGSSGWPLPEKRFDFFPFFRRSIGGGGALLTFPALGASFPH